MTIFGKVAGRWTDLSWDIREEMIDPSSSSLKSAWTTSVLVSTKSMIEAGSKGVGRGWGVGESGEEEGDKRRIG